MAKSSTSFKPGQSGNPNGRPLEPESWAAMVKRIGQQSSPLDSTMTRKQKATEAVFLGAERGNYKAWEALADREEGKPTQPVDHTTQGEKIQLLDPRAAAIVADAEARLKEELLKTKV